MSDQSTTDTSSLNEGAAVSHSVPAALAMRGRVLVAAIDLLVAHPHRAALDERQRAQSLDVLDRLVTGIEIDLRHELGDDSDCDTRAWSVIAPHGLTVPGLARHVLAGVCERRLAREEGVDAAPPAGFAASLDEYSAALWMEYCVAERRRRDGWLAPRLSLSDLPLEMQAALIDSVAGALMVVDRAPPEAIARYAVAAANVVSLHREDIAIGIAADRLVDALLATRSVSAAIDDLLAVGAWPAIAALVAARTGIDRVDAAIYLATATRSEIDGWLAQIDLDPSAASQIVRGLALAGAARDDIAYPASPHDGDATPVREGAAPGISAASRLYAGTER